MLADTIKRAKTVIDVMEPLDTALTPTDLAAKGLALMQAADLPLLPVVDTGSGRLLGAVLRKALENGCVRMRHDPSTCTLHDHLNRNISRCTEDEVLGDDLRAATKRSHVIVVDAHGAPRGFLRDLPGV
jgi:hypothetical protein